MQFGLKQRDKKYILDAVSKFPEIEDVCVFGSRSIGNYKNGSDVDLAITGHGITYAIVLRLRSMLNEELPLPYFFDVVHYDKINNQNLKAHIDNKGQPFV